MCVYNETKKVGVEKEERKKKENPWCSCGLFFSMIIIMLNFFKEINYNLMNNKRERERERERENSLTVWCVVDFF